MAEQSSLTHPLLASHAPARSAHALRAGAPRGDASPSRYAPGGPRREAPFFFLIPQPSCPPPRGRPPKALSALKAMLVSRGQLPAARSHQCPAHPLDSATPPPAAVRCPRTHLYSR